MKGIIHHIEIYVSDLAASKKFWSWLLIKELDYEMYQDWTTGISYKIQNTYIVFVQTEKEHLQPAYHCKQTVLNHLAFHGSYRKMVDELTIKLKEKQIPILYKDKHPYAGGQNYYAVFFEDPDRIKVEIVAPIEK
jgi:catechol 2,3-dioxygenase-like lactoylglutathione lyase family enzyme